MSNSTVASLADGMSIEGDLASVWATEDPRKKQDIAAQLAAAIAQAGGGQGTTTAPAAAAPAGVTPAAAAPAGGTPGVAPAAAASATGGRSLGRHVPTSFG
jgi:hypothetical protein